MRAEPRGRVAIVAPRGAGKAFLANTLLEATFEDLSLRHRRRSVDSAGMPDETFSSSAGEWDDCSSDSLTDDFSHMSDDDSASSSAASDSEPDAGGDAGGGGGGGVGSDASSPAGSMDDLGAAAPDDSGAADAPAAPAAAAVDVIDLPADFAGTVNWDSERRAKESVADFSQVAAVAAFDPLAADRCSFVLPQGPFGGSAPRCIRLSYGAVPLVRIRFVEERTLRDALWQLHAPCASSCIGEHLEYLRALYRQAVGLPPRAPTSAAASAAATAAAADGAAADGGAATTPTVPACGARSPAEIPLAGAVLAVLGRLVVFRGRGADLNVDRIFVRERLLETLTSLGYLVADVLVQLPCGILHSRELQVVETEFVFHHGESAVRGGVPNLVVLVCNGQSVSVACLNYLHATDYLQYVMLDARRHRLVVAHVAERWEALSSPSPGRPAVEFRSRQQRRDAHVHAVSQLKQVLLVRNGGDNYGYTGVDSLEDDLRRLQDGLAVFFVRPLLWRSLSCRVAVPRERRASLASFRAATNIPTLVARVQNVLLSRCAASIRDFGASWRRVGGDIDEDQLSLDERRLHDLFASSSHARRRARPRTVRRRRRRRAPDGPEAPTAEQARVLADCDNAFRVWAARLDACKLDVFARVQAAAAEAVQMAEGATAAATTTAGAAAAAAGAAAGPCGGPVRVPDHLVADFSRAAAAAWHSVVVGPLSGLADEVAESVGTLLADGAQKAILAGGEGGGGGKEEQEKTMRLQQVLGFCQHSAQRTATDALSRFAQSTVDVQGMLAAGRALDAAATDSVPRAVLPPTLDAMGECLDAGRATVEHVAKRVHAMVRCLLESPALSAGEVVRRLSAFSVAPPGAPLPPAPQPPPPAPSPTPAPPRSTPAPGPTLLPTLPPQERQKREMQRQGLEAEAAAGPMDTESGGFRALARVHWQLRLEDQHRQQWEAPAGAAVSDVQESPSPRAPSQSLQQQHVGGDGLLPASGHRCSAHSAGAPAAPAVWHRLMAAAPPGEPTTAAGACAALASRVAASGLEARAVKADAHSQFRSLAALVFGGEEAFPVVRLLLCSEILAAPHRYERLIADPRHGVDLELYVWRLSCEQESAAAPVVDGDHVTLQAFANLQGIRVVVHHIAWGAPLVFEPVAAAADKDKDKDATAGAGARTPGGCCDDDDCDGDGDGDEEEDDDEEDNACVCYSLVYANGRFQPLFPSVPRAASLEEELGRLSDLHISEGQPPPAKRARSDASAGTAAAARGGCISSPGGGGFSSSRGGVSWGAGGGGGGDAAAAGSLRVPSLVDICVQQLCAVAEHLPPLGHVLPEHILQRFVDQLGRAGRLDAPVLERLLGGATMISLRLRGCPLASAELWATVAHVRGLRAADLSRSLGLSSAGLAGLAHAWGATVETLVLARCEPAVDLPSLRAVAAHTGARLQHLDVSFCPGVDDDGLRTVCASARALRSLRARGCAGVTAAALADAPPTLELVDLRDCASVGPAVCAALAPLPLVSVALASPALADPAALARLVGSARRTLRHALLADCSALAAPALATLAECVGPVIETLAFRHCRALCSAPAAPLVRACASFRSLRSLDLTASAVSSTAVIAAVSNCVELRTLVVSHCVAVGDEALAYVARRCPLLEELNVASCGAVSDAAVADIARSCARLRVFHAANCRRLTDAAPTALAAGASGPRLRDVDFSSCPALTDAAAAALGNGCAALARVALDECAALTDRGVRALARGCPGLVRVSLACCPHLTDAALEALAPLAHLRHLDVSHCTQLSARVLAARLSGWPELATLAAKGLPRWTSEELWHPALRVLNLSWCKNVRDAAVCGLGASCPALAWVEMAYCRNVTSAAVLALAAQGQCVRHINARGCAVSARLLRMRVAEYRCSIVL